MAPNILHLPNGQNITVSGVYGGLYFKFNDLNIHQHSQMPPGWTIVLHSEDDERREDGPRKEPELQEDALRQRLAHVHRYKKPTLQNDALFISSISNPSSSDFKPSVSPTRQIAMMLWATLWWYFHQPEPEPQHRAVASEKTADPGRPKGEWRIRIKREGILYGRHLLPKLERMGLIASEESSVGVEDEKHGKGWEKLFVSQRAFWQIDARIFLFTLSPTHNSPFPPGTPYSSRPSSPSRDSLQSPPPRPLPEAPAQGLWSASPNTGPFASSSHLPTYYPPHPPQYVFSNNVRHPLRSKPPRQGETFYTRFIPSQGQYLSFRVASLSSEPVPHKGPVASSAAPSFLPPGSALTASATSRLAGIAPPSTSDVELLHRWMNDARVSAFWGVQGPISVQEEFLRNSLSSRHSFPVIGCWDGRPFGYFEIYWAKEDQLGPHVDSGAAGDWDRGIHVLVGEQEFRGRDRVRVWLSALVHYCWLADQRTNRVLAEPRVDNPKFIKYLEEAGFSKEREVTFSYKQSALMKVLREAWLAPAL